MRKIKIILVAIILLFSTTNAFAVERKSTRNIDTKKYEYLIKKHGDKTMQKNSILEDEIKALRKTFMNKGYSKDMSNRLILKTLGYNEGDLEKTEQSLINELLDDSTEIIVTVEYVKSTLDGEEIILSEEECLAELAVVQGILPPLDDGESRNSGYASQTSSDGYMRITTIATYNSNSAQKGWYTMSGMFTWLKIASGRLVDAMSIGGNTTISLANSNSDFSGKMTYVRAGSTYSEYGSLRRESNGFAYEFQLPSGILTSLYFTITGKMLLGVTSGDLNFQMLSKYIHVSSYVTVRPSFGWSTSGPSISLSPSVNYKYSEYTGSCLINYSPNNY